MTVTPPSDKTNGDGLADGNWHNVTLTSHNRGLRLLLDGVRVGDELDLAGVHDFLDPYLTAVFLGGIKRERLTLQDSAPVRKYTHPRYCQDD
jgi:protocadherin Fat 4